MGATPSTKGLTNNKFTQKEDLYSDEIHNWDSKTKIQIKGQIRKPLTGRTCLFLTDWRKITQNKSVLDIVKGYKIPFVHKPTQTYHAQTQPTDPEEDLLISFEISHLLEKGAIEEVDMSQLHYSNSLFLVANVQEEKAGYKSLTFKQIYSK